MLIPVTVTDPLNRPVTGLEKEHFRLFEEKVEQDIAHFASDDAPLAVGLVFDVSGSMGEKLRKSRQAAAQFFQAANPEDEFFLVEFNDRPRLTVPLTPNVEEIQNRLTFLAVQGTHRAAGRHLHGAARDEEIEEAAQGAADPLRRRRQQQPLHRDRSAHAGARERLPDLRHRHLRTHGRARPHRRGDWPGPGLLSHLAEQTGGKHIPVDNVSELPDVAAKIGIELRNRYVLGFSPKTPQRDGKYHRVQVKIVQPRGLPPLRASYRMGYYAPVD